METLKMTYIRQYENEIANLEWHLKNNNDHIKAEEERCIHIRISDRKEFINILSKL